MDYTIDKVLNAMKAKGYAIFENDSKPFNLNLVGIRNSDKDSNKFNDTLCAFYKYNGKWILHQFAVTTDPGIVYRKKPVNAAGTAILLPGQYRGMWKLGKHKGKYPALVQNKPCTVIRDNDKDAKLDVIIPPYKSIRVNNKGSIVTNDYIDENSNVVFTTQIGHFGINCHKSGIGTTEEVNYYSAGCVVFANNGKFDEDFLDICNAAASVFGNSFTFTLLSDIDV